MGFAFVKLTLGNDVKSIQNEEKANAIDIWEEYIFNQESNERL